MAAAFVRTQCSAEESQDETPGRRAGSLVLPTVRTKRVHASRATAPSCNPSHDVPSFHRRRTSTRRPEES